MRLGTRNRHADLAVYGGRFPTVRGENPPQGIAYRAFEVRLWPSRRSLQIRWWRW